MEEIWFESVNNNLINVMMGEDLIGILYKESEWLFDLFDDTVFNESDLLKINNKLKELNLKYLSKV